jgi:hypothetical protein
MAGPGFGYGQGSARRHRPMGGGSPTPTPSYTAGFMLTQFATHEAKRIHQRATTSGGGQGKGQGMIRVPISGATAGTVGARIRSEDGVTILQPAWLAGTIANGAGFIDLPGIDARLGWFYVDLQGADGNWQLGTVKVGMGALFGFAGQSLTVRLFGRQDGQSATYASLGITPDANSAVLASYNDANGYQPAISTMPWITPGDVGNGNGPNACGTGEFLNRMIALLGVNCGAISHSQGGVSISTFMAGQSNWTQLSDMLARAGGAFEGFVWGQGHSDAGYGAPPRAYAGMLTRLFAQIGSANSFAGYGKYVWTIPNIRSSSWGTPFEINWIRKGARDWCDANGATYVHLYDIDLSDNVHQSQVGSAAMGRHIYRAMRARYGASSGLGPEPVSASRSGTTITLTLSDAGQTNLILAGAPGSRVFIFPKGRVDRANLGNNRFPVASMSVTGATTLAIILADDPGDGQELDLWLYWSNGPVSAVAVADNIYDDRTDGDGLSTGRIVQANFAPVQIAAPNPGGTINAPPGGFVAASSPFNMAETSTAYAASDSPGFGQQVTAGTPQVSGSSACFAPFTMLVRFTCPTISGTKVIFGGHFGDFIAVNGSGKVTTGNGTGATTLIAGKVYVVAYTRGPNGTQIYLANITEGTTPTRDYNSGTAVSNVNISATKHALRNHQGGSAMGDGAVDEAALFYGQLYSGTSWAPPSAPLTGTETDIVALWHCDGDVKDAVAA